MDFLDAEIEKYVTAHTQEEPALLKQINRDTHAKVLMPRMLSGHLQGQVLSMLSHMVKPKQVLEIGTYTGYSAICLAAGLQAGGMLHTIDINEELRSRVKKYIESSGMNDKINYYIGDAVKIIPGMKEKFDLVFIDADKENYSNYYDLVFDKVNTGGFLIADNVLWSGKVTENPEKMDKETRAIDEFNKKVYRDKRVEKVIFPIRDGLMVVRKM